MSYELCSPPPMVGGEMLEIERAEMKARLAAELVRGLNLYIGRLIPDDRRGLCAVRSEGKRNPAADKDCRSQSRQ